MRAPEATALLKLIFPLLQARAGHGLQGSMPHDIAAVNEAT